MNSTDIFLVLEQVSNTGSRLIKEEILKRNLGDNTWRKVLRHALDPYITYGVVKVNCPKIRGTEHFSQETFNLLYRLSMRELTGNKAQDEIKAHLSTLTKESQQLFLRILNKDLRAGFSAVTVNKIVPKLIPSFSVMLASNYSSDQVKLPAFIEPKMDGVRCIVRINCSGQVQFFSRSGKEFHNFDHLKDDLYELVKPLLAQVSPIFLDGEVISETFNQVISGVHTKDKAFTDAIYSIFDIFDEETIYKRTLEVRRSLLKGLNWTNPRLRLTPQRTITQLEEIEEFYQEMVSMGYEGAIVKTNSSYEFKRSKSWMKLKPETTEDVYILGSFEGTGKYAGYLGGLYVSSNPREEIHDKTARVGTGFSDTLRQDLWNQRDSLNGRLIEILFQEKMTTGGYRHARFIRFRDSLTGDKE